MDFLLINKKKIIIVSMIVAPLIIMSIITYNFLKKEDPRFTSYSCGKLLSFSDQTLLSDKKIAVSSATSLEESLSPFSFMFSTLSSNSNIGNLVNDSNKLLELAKQKKSDEETNFLTIPKNACYVSTNTGNINQLNRSFSQSQLTNIEVYSWVKTYSDYFPRKFQTINAVIIMNDSAIYTQFNSPSSNSFFSGIKVKNTVYTLDNFVAESLL